MGIKQEFTKQANSYIYYNTIQNKVAKQLASTLSFKPLKVLDLGCGSGAVYNEIGDFSHKFIGIDFSSKMCELHPKNKMIEIYNKNFDSFNYGLNFQQNSFDMIVSASALQWSIDFQLLISNILPLSNRFEFAIFTSDTFKNIFEFLKISSPIKGNDYYISILKEYNATSYIKNYRLDFNNSKELFRYIKKSGVSGGMNKLSYKATKNLIENFPYTYLEFEVLFISFSKS